MKRKILIVAAFISAITISSCKKSDNSQPDAPTTSVNDIAVPAGFNWSSTHTISFTVNVTDTRFGNAVHVISVYDGDPNNGGSLISRGSASLNNAFTSQLSLKTQLSQVYVVKTSPDNSSIIQKVNVGTLPISISIGAVDPNFTSSSTSPSAKVLGGVTSPDCNSGCTVTITSSTNNVSVNNGDLVCITGNNITVNFSGINGGTVRVCGTGVTLQNANIGNSASLIITSSGSAVMSGNLNSTTATIQNFGTLTFSGTYNGNGIFDNEGIFSNSGDFNINSGSTFTNNGTMTISGTLTDNTTSSNATNNSSITTTGDFVVNNNATLVNNCTISAGGKFNVAGTVKNYNLIKSTGAANIGSSHYLYMYNGAMLKASAMQNLDGAIIGSGSTSLVKISGNTTINSGGSVQNAIQYCSGGTFTNNGTFSGGAAQGCTVYIATSGCNSDGNGTPAVVDTDGDGVPDSQDAYPNDATKAYNSYYPSSTGSGTVAFEDQWPSKGDYDMNDVIVGYQYKIVTNASNVVVSVVATYTLNATGGNLANGFGVQFPTTYASVKNVSGGTLESGQAKAVILLFSNSHNEMAHQNTVVGSTTTSAKTYTVSFDVTGGPTISTFGLTSYNPFIYNTTRSREVHLPGQAPTDVADRTLFGTSDDNTSVSASRYYVTKTGLPYALDVPISNFSYPAETYDITRAYLHFSDWATGNGSTYTDWYSNTGTGYRNTTYVYH